MGSRLVAGFMFGQLAGFFEGSKHGLGKGVSTNIDWHWYPPCAQTSTAGLTKGLRDIDCVAGRIKDLTTVPNKKVEGTGIPWAKKGDIINKLDKNKRIDAVFLVGVEKRTIFRPDKGLRVAAGLMAGLDAKCLTTIPNKKIEGASIPWAKREDVINRLDKSKRINEVYSAGVKEGTIFESAKSLRVTSKSMAGLGASIALDKKARSDANCLSDKRRDLSLKPEKGSRGNLGPDGKGGISVAAFGEKKGGIGRHGTGKGC